MKLCKYLVTSVVTTNSLLLSAGVLDQPLYAFHTSPDGFSLLHGFCTYCRNMTGKLVPFFPESFASSLSHYTGRSHSKTGEKSLSEQLCLEPVTPEFSPETPSPGCKPLPESDENMLVPVDDYYPGFHQATMLLPVYKAGIINITVPDIDIKASITPLSFKESFGESCKGACIAWDYNGQASVLELSETAQEPAAVTTKSLTVWEVARTVNDNGDITYQWYDQDGLLYTLSEQEYQRRLSMYFQSLLEYLYPEFFDSPLPAGGGWHRWKYWKVRRVSDRPVKTGEPPWQEQSRRRGKTGKEKLAASARPVQAEQTKRSPACQQSAQNRSGKKLSIRKEGPIEALIKDFEAGNLYSYIKLYGDEYDGRYHGFFCDRIKKVTQARDALLNDEEKQRFEPFMEHLSTVIPLFNERSICTTLHSLTTSGLLVPPIFQSERELPLLSPLPPTLQRLKKYQQNLLQKLLRGVQLLIFQSDEQTGLRGQAVTNLLWSLERLLEQEAVMLEQVFPMVEALVLQVEKVPTKFKHQEIVNLFTSLSKLVVARALGLELAIPTVMVLLPEVRPQDCTSIEVCNYLCSLARFVAEDVITPEQTRRLTTMLLPKVLSYQTLFTAQGIANLLWALRKLVGSKVLTPDQARPGVMALLQELQRPRINFKHQEFSCVLLSLAKLMGTVITPGQAGLAIRILLLRVPVLPADNPRDVSSQMWSLAKLVEDKAIMPKQAESAVKMLLQVEKYQAGFTAVGITSLLWAVAIFMEHRVIISGQARPAVMALLEQMQKHHAEFNRDEIISVRSALLKLMKGRVVTAKQVSEPMALFPCVQSQKSGGSEAKQGSGLNL